MLQHACGILARIRPRFRDVLRAGEWWEFKLVPIFSAFYGTALTMNVPVLSLRIAALTILLSMVPGAVYVSVINDLTDREDDLAAGKANRLVGKSRVAIAAIIAITIAAGLAFAWLWRHDPLLLSCYLAAWLAFSLYSLPPFRFKTRGILGVLCDAGGAHLFPTLVAVILAFRAAGRPIDRLWLAGVGAWAFAYGLRGILWHQLTDAANDRSAGVHTFAERHAPQFVIALGTFVAFPLEMLGLGVMLTLMRSVVPPAFLLIYATFALERLRRWRMHAVIVKPKERFTIVLQEYYGVFFPIAILLASAMHDSVDLIMLAVHCILFPLRPFQVAKESLKLLRDSR
jgi:hypothetical protein